MRLQLLNIRVKMQQLLKSLKNIKKFLVAFIREFPAVVIFIRLFPVRHRGTAAIEATRNDF